MTAWNDAFAGHPLEQSMRISMRVAPGIAVISPAKVAARSACATAVTHFEQHRAGVLTR